MSHTKDEKQPSLQSNVMIDMELKMREQIRLLQEQRAAVMMEEVIDLQRERDLALGRIKILKKNIEDLTMENALLKGAVGRSDLTERLIAMERKSLEERLLTNDLKKKLQTANKQKEELSLKVRKLELESAARQATAFNEERQRDRSQSLTDLNHENVKNKSNGKENSNSPPKIATPEVITPVAKLPPNGKKLSPPFLSASSGQVTPGVRSGTSTPLSYSPAVIPRRYKLAAAALRHCSTQTEPWDKTLSITGDQTAPVSDYVSSLEKDLSALQEAKECVENDLDIERSKRAKEKAAYKKEYAALHTESTVLNESLSEFSVWTRQKLQLFEGDMDIFKVIYSLHGSLSQEKEMLKELRERLTKSESKIGKLENINQQLQEDLSLVEEKYKKCKKEMRRLSEKPLTSTPPAPHYHSNSPASQRHIRSYKSSSHTRDIDRPSSPLLTKTSPPLKGMFPVKVNLV